VQGEAHWRGEFASELAQVGKAVLPEIGFAPPAGAKKKGREMPV